MDVIDQIKNLLNEAVKWLQILGTPAAALAFGIGGFFQIFGGNEGGRKARPCCSHGHRCRQAPRR